MQKLNFFTVIARPFRAVAIRILSTAKRCCRPVGATKQCSKQPDKLKYAPLMGILCGMFTISSIIFRLDVL